MLLDSEFSSFFQFLQWDDKLSEPESSDGQQPETVAEPIPESVAEPELIPESLAEPESGDEPQTDLESETFEEKEERKAQEDNDLELVADDRTQEPTDVGSHTESTSPESSHLFAVKTTGGQEKIVMRLLEARIKMEKINIQSAVLLSDFKGYVVIEAQDPSAMFDAIQGIRHVRGHLRGELTYDDIEKYLIKKSTVSELAVENTVEIIGGPFKGMKATITRLDQEKEEATVVLLDATYQLPVTVDANYLKLVPA